MARSPLLLLGLSGCLLAWDPYPEGDGTTDGGDSDSDTDGDTDSDTDTEVETGETGTPCDFDRDGHGDPSCGGNDCDDHDNSIFRSRFVLDGIDDYVLVADEQNAFGLTRDFTVSASVRLPDPGGEDYAWIFAGEQSWSSDPSRNAGFGLWLQGPLDPVAGAIAGAFGTGTVPSSGSGGTGTVALSANEWTNVTVVRTGATLALYVGGTLDRTTTVSADNLSFDGAADETDRYEIGMHTAGFDGSTCCWLHGAIRDVGVWNRGLSAPEVSDLAATGRNGTIDAGLKAWWALDEAAGTTARDAMGGSDGTIFGGSWECDR